ncbi:MAG: sugar ABC transporter permease [Microlunatus sp.]|nr:sugar ABC transporter permease [Microlunatus sp.]
MILPWAVPGAVSGILWSFILNPTGSGLLNSVLKSVGLISSYQAWLNKPVAGIIAIGLTAAWSGVPLGVIILLAGLEAVPKDIYEQSTVDGASLIQQFFLITLPLLRPAIAIVLLNGGGCWRSDCSTRSTSSSGSIPARSPSPARCTSTPSATSTSGSDSPRPW